MRILAAADVHGMVPVYDWLESQAHRSGVDAVVLAGDLLGAPEEIEDIVDAQRWDADRVRPRLESLAVPVLYLMGNDDWVDLCPGPSSLRPLHMRFLETNGFRFVGYSCTNPFMGGPLEKSEAGQEIDLARLSEWVDERTVVVTHGPVHGVLDVGMLGVSIGSRALEGLLTRRPFLLHIHGHVHSAFGRSGRHLNVASGGVKRGMIVDLTTLESVVVGSG